MPNMILKANHRSIAFEIVVNFAAFLIMSFSQPALAQSPQKTFASAAQAAGALYDAVRDRNDQSVQQILGGAVLASSGDTEQDRLEREHFAEKYQQMHRLVRELDGSIVLYIGAENWPFPIPLIVTNGAWHFDTDAGSEEVVAREIGENELAAIGVCAAIGKNSNPNAKDPHENQFVIEFARKLSQSEGASSSSSEPFQGYNFRILKDGSGENLVVAYPVEYRRSGVMTFVQRGGTTYEKDLGPNTATAAQQIQNEPTKKWSLVQYPANF